MNRAIVTGGAGFIGSFLCDELVSRDVEVLAIDNLFRGRQANLEMAISTEKCELQVLDLSIEESISQLSTAIDNFKPDVIYHLAAVNGTKYFYEKPLFVLNQNVQILENVYASAAASSFVGTIVFTSSSEVYGDPEVIPTPESAPVVIRPTHNRDSYALSKVLGEMATRMMAEQLGWDYSILRLFNSYGPRMDSSEYGQVVPEFIRKVESSDSFTLIGSGRQTRSFCYVEDTAYLIAEAAGKFRNTTVNVGIDHEIPIGDLAVMIHELVGREPSITYLPSSEGDHERRCPDISLQTKLAGEREFVSLDDGLRRCIDWYLG
jgi:UDP-glucuronate decarboxylase